MDAYVSWNLAMVLQKVETNEKVVAHQIEASFPREGSRSPGSCLNVVFLCTHHHLAGDLQAWKTSAELQRERVL